MATLDPEIQKPHQPKEFSFPKRSFGKKNVVQRAFLSSWFDKWKWIHYEETADAAFCYVCMKADKAGKLKANSKDFAFHRRDLPTGRIPQRGFVNTN